MLEVFITIQNTNLTTLTTDMNTNAVNGYKLKSFQKSIDSSDVITYTVIMSVFTASV